MIVGSAVAVALLMATASAIGILHPSLYRDNALVTAGWLGNDLVTLLLAVPSLMWATVLVRRGSSRALVIAMGLSAYALYSYAFYLFGAAFNAAFLLYVAILAAATLSLIFGLASRRMASLASGLDIRPAHRHVGIAVATVATLLGLFWVATSAAFWFAGEVPPMVSATGHPTNVVGALDLWLVVTLGLWGGIWLARGGSWGYILSAVWTVKGAYYMAALSAATVTAYRAGTHADLTQLGLWFPIGAICTAAAAALVRALPVSNVV